MGGTLLVLASAAFAPPTAMTLGTIQTRSRATSARCSVREQLSAAAPSAAAAPSTAALDGKVVPSAVTQRGRKALTLTSILAGLGIAGYFLTLLLGSMTGPVAGGLKLIYAGAVAGITSRSFCAPLEMVSTVMMCRGNECTSMWDELRRTWRKEGVDGLWRGNVANCLKVAPSRGTQFLVYEFAKRRIASLGWGLVAGGTSLNAGARLCAGGVAGMVAAVMVYPLEVIKTLRTVYPNECTGLLDAARCAVKYGGGVTALYAGVLPTLIAMFPYVGVEFMVYETLKRRWAALFGGSVSTLALLAIGAVAGAAGQMSAHPLDVVRRRMQMEGLRKAFGKGESDDGKPKQAPVTNLVSGVWNIGRTEGWHVLFKGLGPACFEKVPSTAIGYYIYEAMKGAMGVSSL